MAENKVAKKETKNLPTHHHHTITFEDSFMGIPMPIFLIILLIIGFTFGYVASYQLVQQDVKTYKDKIADCLVKNMQFKEIVEQKAQLTMPLTFS